MEEQYAKYKSWTGAAADNKRHCINCEVCGASLAAGSYQSHLETQHNVFDLWFYNGRLWLIIHL
jgi:hypothetical protein